MMSFLCVTLDFEFANASTIVFGLNAAARPNIELAFRKRRRDLSSVCFIVSSLWVVSYCLVADAFGRDCRYQGE
jgi:hypothetical protein